jgi:hypothetical protein
MVLEALANAEDDRGTRVPEAGLQVINAALCSRGADEMLAT